NTGYEEVGCLFVARDEAEAGHLPETLRIMTERRDDGVANIGDLSIVDGKTARSLFPPLAEFPASIYLSAAARVDGRLLRDSLRRAAEKRGAVAITGTAEPAIAGDRAVGVLLDGHLVPADQIVISGGAWSNDLGDLLGLSLPIEPQRGQIIHLEVPGTDT